jgi:plasmid maintenance system antidote protein VapI
MVKEEFLTDDGLSQNRLAKAVGISPSPRLSTIGGASRLTPRFG